mgnify:CR=1 FL=1
MSDINKSNHKETPNERKERKQKQILIDEKKNIIDITQKEIQKLNNELGEKENIIDKNHKEILKLNNIIHKLEKDIIDKEKKMEKYIQENDIQENDIQENNIQENGIQKNNIQENGIQKNDNKEKNNKDEIFKNISSIILHLMSLTYFHTDLVSVIIPSYNRYDQLLVAIYSVKNQTYKNIEIIVIDDGSSDERYKNKIDNVTMINLGENCSKIKLGYSSGGLSRNCGLKHANGKYIAFLDDDDYWLPNKLELQVNILRKEKNILACCSDAYLSSEKIIIDHKTDELLEYNKQFYWDLLSNKLNLNNSYPNNINENILNKHNLVITSSFIFDRKLIDKAGYFPEYENGGTNGLYQDYEYWKEIIKYTKFHYFNYPLIIYYLKINNLEEKIKDKKKELNIF